jgi:phosphoglycerate dehydrogenase-like enzyme
VRHLVLGLDDGSEAWTIPDAEVESLRRDVPDLRVTHARSDEELAAAVPDAEILFTWAHGEEMMARAERLRWLHVPSAGVGSFLTPSVRARRPVLTNSRGVHAVPIAEHVLGMLVALARRFRPAMEEQAEGDMRREGWWSGTAIPRELSGRVLGLYGYGAIGRETARRARAFGMRVLALKRRPERAPEWDPELLRALGLPAEEPGVEVVLGPDGMDRLLAESDAIVVAAPLTSETEGAFDARAFERMKRGAWFVNVARGKIHRERDLAAALRRGHLGGAALDVFEREPLPPGSELYSLDNVILTPHVSGLSTGFWPRAMALFRANLARDAEGRPYLNRVDLERGY